MSKIAKFVKNCQKLCFFDNFQCFRTRWTFYTHFFWMTHIFSKNKNEPHFFCVYSVKSAGNCDFLKMCHIFFGLVANCVGDIFGQILPDLPDLENFRRFLTNFGKCYQNFFYNFFVTLKKIKHKFFYCGSSIKILYNIFILLSTKVFVQR